MARFVNSGTATIMVNGTRIDTGATWQITSDDIIRLVWDSPKDRTPRPGDDPGYDPDYDPELDKLGWDADDFSPNACAPEVAASPYKASDRSYEAQQWRADAIRQESWRREREGRYGAFTDDEMDEARALVRSEMALDPVEEILGHAADWVEGDEPSDERWISADKWATVTFTVDVSGFQSAMQNVQAAFHDTSNAIATWAQVNPAVRYTIDPDVIARLYDLPTDLLGIDTTKPEPTVNRIRHGAASVCPRHGETRGGTCMKCARRRGR